MKIVFMGTPMFAVPSLKALNEKYDVVMVVSQPNRVKKKGVFVDTCVAKCAKELNLNLFQPENIKDEIDKFLSIEADCLVTAAYGQYIPTKILNHFKKCINVHGSILPYHRGGAPIQRAIMEGDSETGVTIMEMAKKLDAGNIYAIEKCPITLDDNATSIFDKLSIIGRNLLLNTIEDIVSGKNAGVVQDEAKATYSPNISAGEEIINLNKNSLDIIHQIQGLAYDPGAYLLVNDVKLKVFKAQAIDYDGCEVPGTVLVTKKKIVIKTKDSAIELLEVLYPGKKIMSGNAFSNGQKIFNVGDVLI